MFEIIAVLFIVAGVISSITQAKQKAKRAEHGGHPPAIDMLGIPKGGTETKETRKTVKIGAHKSMPERAVQIAAPRPVQTRAVLPAVVSHDQDDAMKQELTIDQNSVLNGVIFSVILSPPKAKNRGEYFNF